MVIEKLVIHGLRGFVEEQKLKPSLPNGNMGSGLTILVGSNNSGKSTVIEALRAISHRSQLPSFSYGRRNVQAGDQIKINIVDKSGNTIEMKSKNVGSSEVVVSEAESDLGHIFVLPSRRAFNPFFHKQEFDRMSYTLHGIGFPSQRTSQQDNFSGRLFNAEKNQESFNKVLKKVIDPLPNWTIDLNDSGQYFLKFFKGTSSHSSEGVGEGIVSLFFIVDALYDSSPGDIVVIDEPELSLHPSLQKKLAILISEYAKDRQIIIATHSSYFIDLNNLDKGVGIARVHQKESGTVISQISDESKKFIHRSLKNLFNPHVFGLNAKEMFFLDENIILVEGQDDVIFYKIVVEELGFSLNSDFFGWGIGGADNMGKMAKLLKELGFNKVVGIVDNDREENLEELKEKFETYKFFAIAAPDVRTKPARPAYEEVQGILDNEKKIRASYKESTEDIFNDIINYFD